MIGDPNEKGVTIERVRATLTVRASRHGRVMNPTRPAYSRSEGGIHYKSAEILEVSVKLIGTTAILLNRIRLVAVVGGKEVTNPFVVTEVYVQQGGTWKLGSLSFTSL